MGFTRAKARQILNQEYRTGTVYLALFLNDPTPEATGTEVSGGGYARIAIPFAAPVTEAGAEVIKNSTELQSAVATANWGTVTHVAVMSALTGGTMISNEALVNPKTINTGERFSVLIGNGTIGMR